MTDLGVAAATAPSRSLVGGLGASWRLSVPFLLLHFALLACWFVRPALVVLPFALASYVVRMLGITACYHRYFAHRAYRLGRAPQLVAALLGGAAAQRGPLWWAAHHRQHHRAADQSEDPHSPVVRGVFMSHVGWLFEAANQPTRLERVPDLACFRELRFLDRYHHLVPVGFALATAALGALLGHSFPELHTGALQFVVWVFVVPTIALYHCTFAVNSVAHLWGTRRFATSDASRNNALVALATLGEGWHNNHHRFPSSARQGLAPLEFDPTWLVIRLFERLGIARDVRRAPSWRGEAGATVGKAPAPV